MPLIVSSAVAAICGAWYAWRKRSARDQQIFSFADVGEGDSKAALMTADIVEEVVCDLPSLGAQFDRLKFHMCISVQDASLSILRVDGRLFEVEFYFDPREESDLANRIQQFFASCTIKASQDSLNHVSGKIALRVVNYPLGASAHDAAEICGELLRSAFHIANSDIVTVRHSRNRALSNR